MDEMILIRTLGAYQERLLKTINDGWWALPADLVNQSDQTDKVLALCHIVDGNLILVKETALLERDMGIFSTYLFGSYIEVPEIQEQIAFIASLGHEVGISLELLAPFINEYTHPHDTIRKAIAPFRSLGIPPKTCHFPISPLSQLVMFNNFDYFSDFGEEKTLKIKNCNEINSNRMVRVGVHPMKEYGFEYAIDRITFSNIYDNRFEGIKPEDTGKSIIYLNLSKWEVSCE